MLEPGLDRHDWETQWQALEPLLEDSPTEALPEAVALVERILTEVGLDPDDDTHLAEDAGELLLELRRARETSPTLEQGGEFDPGDVGAAVLGLRSVYDQLLDERRAL
jgi:hypothetical protein